MSRPRIRPWLQRSLLTGFAGMALLRVATSQESQPTLVTSVDLYRNPYSYEKKIFSLDPIPVPFVYNGRVMLYSQSSPSALALGISGVSFERALDAKRLLFDLRQEDYATRSSDLATYGQLLVIVRESQQLPLRLDRPWILKGLGSMEGTNAFGARLTVPLVEFLYYSGDEPSMKRVEPTKRTDSLPAYGSSHTATDLPQGCIPLDINTSFHGRVIIHEGNQPWTALKLEHPICVDDSGSRLEEIQLLDVSGGALFEALNNTPVKMAGKLVSGEGSPYYKTFFAIDVKSIRTPEGNTIVPVAAKEVLIPKAVTNYKARISTAVDPDHIIRAAWSESGRQLEPVNAYVAVSLNGTGDLAHARCGDGFVISNIGSRRFSPEAKRDALKYSDLPIGIGDEPISVDFSCRRQEVDVPKAVAQTRMFVNDRLGSATQK